MASRANGLSATHFRLLDDLLRTKKLSATAANFGISVSSASRMLMQLREVFNEPLFTTTASGLQPTAAMLRMAPRLDAYLKAFDEEDGVESYGKAADLLIAWYLQETA